MPYRLAVVDHVLGKRLAKQLPSAGHHVRKSCPIGSSSGWFQPTPTPGRKRSPEESCTRRLKGDGCRLSQGRTKTPVARLMRFAKAAKYPDITKGSMNGSRSA